MNQHPFIFTPSLSASQRVLLMSGDNGPLQSTGSRHWPCKIAEQGLIGD